MQRRRARAPLRVVAGGFVMLLLSHRRGVSASGGKGVGSVLAAAEAGVEDVAEPVAEEVGAEDD